ncbi:PQQ-binding-like beta-propeller repeat protein, partial [Singulisphaera rosea]
NTGSPRWSTSTHGGRLLAASPSRLYLETHDDDLFIIERTTGRMVVDPRSSYQRAGLNLRDFNIGVTNDLNDRVYLATSSGLIIALREIGHTQPHLIRDPKAPPLGYIPPEGLPDTQTQAVPTTPPLAPGPDEATPKSDEGAADEEKAAPKEEADAPQ